MPLCPSRDLISLVLLATLAPGAASADDGGAGLRLVIESPTPGAVVGPEDSHAFVTGRALVAGRVMGTFDVIVVIDTSHSTSAASGADVDADGRTGRPWGSGWLPPVSRFFQLPNSDPGDSVLAAEVAAARTLLEQLDPKITHVGVVSFSGFARGIQPEAWIEVPLTGDFEKVARGLERLLDRGPRGHTNMLAGVETAVAELTDSFAGAPRDGARKLVLFMTDGLPTLPLPHAPMENARLAVEAARRAADYGVRVDTFAIGPVAMSAPHAPVEMARVTGGVFTAVEDPRDLVAEFARIRLAELESVDVVNLTLGASATSVSVSADGAFSALVPLRDGDNRIEVRVVTGHAGEARETLRVRRLRGAATPVLRRRLQERRTRLLQRRLGELRQRSGVIRAELAERVRRELSAAAARQRTRRSLQIEVEGDAARRRRSSP